MPPLRSAIRTGRSQAGGVRLRYENPMTLHPLSSHGRSSSPCLRRLSPGGEEGGALVELGVSLPIIFLVMTGIFAFSIGLYQKLSLAEGISSGGRTLAVSRGATDPCATTASAITAAAPSLSSSNMKLTFVVNGTTVVNNVAASSASCSSTTMTAGNSASVTGTYPCSIGIFRMTFPSCSMSFQVAEQVQ